MNSLTKYQPETFEEKWYQFWESNHYFSPDIEQQTDLVYTIVIPPPNVTGSLHIGHALVNTLQDILIRWKRMQGYKTLWLPGTDHAGIATQMVVERELNKKGLKRETLGREKFVEEIWKWKKQYGGKIFQQLRRLGASLDWKRERFTLDEGLSRAVKKCFVKLYEEGLIYRGEYLVNWCPKDKTALSDLEVDHLEISGEITNICYPLENKEGFIEIATTRPETMLGDTAIAVHPEDARYKKWIGKKVMVPLVERWIPIIADEHCDMEFGTGAVKVTPAHDPNDFEIAKRHQLPSITIFSEDGKVNDVFPDLQGIDRFTARTKIIELLKKNGFWKSTKIHVHSVGHCQRCKTILEPRISKQWFCSMQEMAKKALEYVEQKEVRFIPENQGKIFYEWLRNIQDWCISRQLWWGHRIPAWYCQECDQTLVSEQEITSCSNCSSKLLQPEEDVLDTWFSSGLFPFSTMGWPDETAKDYQTFYPNSALITGYDILFFWVARMIMMGIKLTGKVPFSEVFLHGLVRDEHGEKMSKTKGNVIDPLNLIEKHGADSMRFTLCSLTVMGRDIKLPEKQIESNKNFINKLWNATKFTLFHAEKLGTPQSIQKVSLGLFDQWILEKLNVVCKEVDMYLTKYRFNEVAKVLYHFVWHELCDWYIEIIKPMLFNKMGIEAQQASFATLCYVLSSSLRLLHPITPFVTEELWQHLSWTKETIMKSPYPKYTNQTSEKQLVADQLIELINAIRNIRGENNIPPKAELDITIITKDTHFIEQLKNMSLVIQMLAKVKQIHQPKQFIQSEGFAGSIGKGFEVFVDLRESIDIEQESLRLNKEKEKLLKKQQQLKHKLENQAFLSKAPEHVIQKNQSEYTSLQNKLQKIKENLDLLQ